MHPAALPEEELEKELRFEATRSTGPGGQRNFGVGSGGLLLDVA